MYFEKGLVKISGQPSGEIVVIHTHELNTNCLLLLVRK